MQVEIIFPNQSIKIYQINKEQFTIGRSKTCDISLSEDGISRQHMFVEQKSNIIYVKDLKSTNGIYLNNEKIPADCPIQYMEIFDLRIGPLVISIKADTDEKNKSDSSATKNIPPTFKAPEKSKKSVIVKDKKVVLKSKTEPQVLVFAFLIVCYFGYDYFSKKRKNEKSTHTTSEQKELSIKDTPPLLIELLNKKKCQDEMEKNLCKLIGYSFQNRDGIIIRGDEVYLFMDFEKHALDNSFKENYLNLKREKRFELLMLMEAFNDQIRDALQNNKLGSLYIADYASGSDTKSKIIKVLKLTSANRQILSSRDIQTVFEALQKNDPSYYKAIMKPLIEWTN